MEKESKTSENNELVDSNINLETRAESNFRRKLKSFYSSLEPTIKNSILRYTVSFIFIAIVVYFYIVFEGNREDEIVRVFFFDMSSSLLVPLALIFAFIAVLYISWDDKFFKRFRSPGLYMVLLTGIFYILIFSGIDEYLFQFSLAKWLTQATAVIVIALAKLFGMNIVDTNWNPDESLTIIQFEGPNGLSSIGIDARCSGIHSLTIFVAIFLLMLFEARKRLKWSNYGTIADLKSLVKEKGISGVFEKEGLKTLLIVKGTFLLNLLRIIGILLVGLIGTYLINIIRVTIIFIINYFNGWGVAGPIHNYLGYVFLMIWVPIFWLFILPIFEKKKKTAKSEDSLNESIYISEDTDNNHHDSEVKTESIQHNLDEK